MPYQWYLSTWSCGAWCCACSAVAAASNLSRGPKPAPEAAQPPPPAPLLSSLETAAAERQHACHSDRSQQTDLGNDYGRRGSPQATRRSRMDEAIKTSDQNPRASEQCCYASAAKHSPPAGGAAPPPAAQRSLQSSPRRRRARCHRSRRHAPSAPPARRTEARARRPAPPYRNLPWHWRGAADRGLQGTTQPPRPKRSQSKGRKRRPQAPVRGGREPGRRRGRADAAAKSR